MKRLLFPFILLALVVGCSSGTFSCQGDGVIIEEDAGVCPPCECECPENPDGGTPDGSPDAGDPDASPPEDPDASPAPDASPPASTNTVEVRFKPHADVADGSVIWVSFTLPLPPGVLADPSQIRLVDENGAEVNVFTKSLGDWSSVPPAELLCSDLPKPQFPGNRAVLIQFREAFHSTDDLVMTVHLGETPSNPRTVGVPPFNTLRIVGDGESTLYGASDGIMEPSVYALPDINWMRCANLVSMPSASNLPGIGTSPVLEKVDEAQLNFFYTYINDFRDHYTDPENSRPVSNPAVDLTASTDSAWLYDRVSAMFAGYLRSGNFDMFKNFYRAAYHYRTLIYTPDDCSGSSRPDWCVGFFSVKNDNPNSSWKDGKYSYGEAITLNYWMTGDDTLLPYAEYVFSAGNKENDPRNRFYTERNAAFALMSGVMLYELTGEQQYLDFITDTINHFKGIQDTPTSEGTVNGCFNHSFEGVAEGFSPWMTALLANSFLRAYHATGDSRVPGMLSELARCEVERGMAYTDQIQNTRMLIPFYGGAATGDPRDLDGDNPWQGIEHAYDVAQAVAIGAFFTEDDAEQAMLLSMVVDLVASHHWVIDNWTRDTPDRPRYRLSPVRKYPWWFKNSHVVSWVIGNPATLN